MTGRAGCMPALVLPTSTRVTAADTAMMSMVQSGTRHGATLSTAPELSANNPAAAMPHRSVGGALEIAAVSSSPSPIARPAVPPSLPTSTRRDTAPATASASKSSVLTRAPDETRDIRDEGCDVDGLGDVVVEALEQESLAVALHGVRRHCCDRDAAEQVIAPERREHLVAGHVRELDVQEDQVRHPLAGKAKRVSARAGGQRLVAVHAQQLACQLQAGVVVLHHQDHPVGHGLPPCRPSAAR